MWPIASQFNTHFSSGSTMSLKHW